jgi:hypothetical protein
VSERGRATIVVKSIAVDGGVRLLRRWPQPHSFLRARVFWVGGAWPGALRRGRAATFRHRQRDTRSSTAPLGRWASRRPAACASHRSPTCCPQIGAPSSPREGWGKYRMAALRGAHLPASPGRPTPRLLCEMPQRTARCTRRVSRGVESFCVFNTLLLSPTLSLPARPLTRSPRRRPMRRGPAPRGPAPRPARMQR